jgi:xylan 1,4-beta-xylosidase
VDRFIAWAAQSGSPVDYVSTHVYANDTAKDVFGTNENIARRDMVGRAVRKVYGQVQTSRKPGLPIIWSEYNASYMNEVNVTDSAFMGPWLANNIRVCDGLTEAMSYWTFSDVFEEQGVVKTPFYGGYGLIANDGIPKPAFNAFALLHRLGTERLANASENVLVTRGPNNVLAIAVWNYADPGQAGAPRTFRIEFTRGTPVLKVTVIDEQRGSSLAAWKAMGSPAYPTRDQVEHLRRAAALPAPVRFSGTDITLPPHALALFESDR